MSEEPELQEIVAMNAKLAKFCQSQGWQPATVSLAMIDFVATHIAMIAKTEARLVEGVEIMQHMLDCRAAFRFMAKDKH